MPRRADNRPVSRLGAALSNAPPLGGILGEGGEPGRSTPRLATRAPPRSSAPAASPSTSTADKRIARIDQEDIQQLEAWIDQLDGEPPPLQSFILPGGPPASAAPQLARTIARRAERSAFRLAREEDVNEHAVIYLSRLSDLLFVLARVVNRRSGVDEVKWHGKGSR